MTVTLLPVAASAATVTARDIDSACPPGWVPSAPFTDTDGIAFEGEIDCIVGYGVAAGTTATTYAPTLPVRREQMASFIANVLVAAGRTRPATLPNAFPDDDRSAHRLNIDWLAQEGVVGGFSDGTFRPTLPVNRAQMATFLSNVIRELTGIRLTSDTDFFTDDERLVHEANINGLAARGIVTGVADSRYDPAGLVTRAQMAGFLARTVDYLVDHDEIEMPFGPEELEVTPTSSLALLNSDNSSDRTDDRGRREYRVAVPLDISRISIVLMPSEQVVVRSDGTLRFTSNAPYPANAGVSIEYLDDTKLDEATGTNDITRVNDVAVGSDGYVDVTIDANVVASVRPVAYVDTVRPAENQLDLESGASVSNPRPALETVAAGGVTSWGPPEPSRNQDLSLATVRDVNVARGWYTLDTGGGVAPEYLVRIVTGDTYTYTASNEPVAGSPGPIVRSQFETWLSPGDRVNVGPYNPGRTSHVLVGDVPLAPTGVSASVQSDGRVRVTFAKPSNPVADDRASSFRLQRATVVSGTIGSFVEVAARAADLTPEFLDSPPATGTFAYRVIARSVTGDSPASVTVQVTVAAPPPATTGSRVALDSTPTGTLSNGDRLEFTFDRAITVSGGWNVVLLDGDGTQVRLEAGTATPSVSGSAGNVLTLFVGPGAPVVVADGANKVLNLTPANQGGFVQVVSAQSIGNASGAWNLPRSGLPGSPYNSSRMIIEGIVVPPVGGYVTASASTRLLQAGLDEVQTITPATNATGGTWTLTFAGQETADLAWDANASQIQAALVALSNVGAGGAVVTGGPLPTATITIRFANLVGATDVAQVTVDIADLTAPSGQAVATPLVSTLVQGAAVTGLVAGDRLTVHTTAGVRLADAVAGTNGRTTVSLPSIASGQQLYLVVEKAGAVPYRSRTATIVATS